MDDIQATALRIVESLTDDQKAACVASPLVAFATAQSQTKGQPGFIQDAVAAMLPGMCA